MPTGLMAEGLAMLQSVLTDFKAWDGANIITTRDRRLAHVSLPADCIVDLDFSTYYSTLEQLAGQCSAALIIAPENDGILERLSALAESQGARLLGSSPESIAIAANKWECYLLFNHAGLATPDTWCVDVKKAQKKAEKIGFPLVVKPLDGVDCEGVCLIHNSSSLYHIFAHNMLEEKEHILMQRYIEGQHASASLLIAENDIKCLSLNKQTIKIGMPFSYQGSEVPFISDKHDEAVELAKNAAALIPGLSGYVGVDLVINEDACYIIEINPRLTASYICLRQVVNINVAEAIWNASMKGILPQEITLSGVAAFTKEDQL